MGVGPQSGASVVLVVEVVGTVPVVDVVAPLVDVVGATVVVDVCPVTHVPFTRTSPIAQLAHSLDVGPLHVAQLGSQAPV
jgi:hypothetical protein